VRQSDQGLLFSQGVGDYEPLRRDRRRRLDPLRTGDGRPLGNHLKAEILRELDRIELLLEQTRAVEREREALLADLASRNDVRSEAAAPAPVGLLMRLKGIGPEFAASLWTEGLCRSFANRRQAGAYGGLTPTPWRSGAIAHEQGVSKAGNRRLRKTRLQVAWLWLIHQPQSALARWFHARLPGMAGKAAHEAVDRRARLQAVRRPVEIHQRRRRHRGSRHENFRLIEGRAKIFPLRHPPRPDQPRPIRVGEPMDCMASKRRCEEWSRLPSLRRRKRNQGALASERDDRM
jgi:Transposase IS116/IS110/IS902 family